MLPPKAALEGQRIGTGNAFDEDVQADQVHRSILTLPWIEPPLYRTNRLSNQEEL